MVGTFAGSWMLPAASAAELVSAVRERFCVEPSANLHEGAATMDEMVDAGASVLCGLKYIETEGAVSPACARESSVHTNQVSKMLSTSLTARIQGACMDLKCRVFCIPLEKFQPVSCASSLERLIKSSTFSLRSLTRPPSGGASSLIAPLESTAPASDCVSLLCDSSVGVGSAWRTLGMAFPAVGMASGIEESLLSATTICGDRGAGTLERSSLAVALGPSPPFRPVPVLGLGARPDTIAPRSYVLIKLKM